jgi:glycosyltransferase involved in cell wall biosynthesis
MTTAEAIASGSIPFVHNSGGQREIVPDERLRFTDEEYFAKFQALLDLPEAELNQIRQRLSEHIRQYSEEIFIDRMLAYLDKAVPTAGPQAIALPASNG